MQTTEGPGCGVDHHPEDCLCDVVTDASYMALAPPDELARMGLHVGITGDEFADLYEQRMRRIDVRERLRKGESVELSELSYKELPAYFEELDKSPITNRVQILGLIGSLLKCMGIEGVALVLKTTAERVVWHMTSGASQRDDTLKCYLEAEFCLKTMHPKTYVEVARYSGLGEKTIPRLAKMLRTTISNPARGHYKYDLGLASRLRELKQQGLTARQSIAVVAEEMPEEAKDLTVEIVHGITRVRQSRKYYAERQKQRREELAAVRNEVRAEVS